MKRNSIGCLVVIVAVVLGMAVPVPAASFKVSSNGEDSGTCGSGARAPCATIAQAVTNAAGGDSILVGPGKYAGTSVDKAVKLWASGGTGSAVISSTMTLAADGTVFGKKGKGFSLDLGGSGDAVVVPANSVVVRGNLFNDATTGVNAIGDDVVIRDNRFNNCGVSIGIAGAGAEVRTNHIGYISSIGVALAATSSGAEVRDNRTFGPGGTAFMIDGSDHLLRRNLVQGTPGGAFVAPAGSPTGVELLENTAVNVSSPAFELSSGSGWILTKNAVMNSSAPAFYLVAATPFTVTGNVAIGNDSYGFFISGGSNHVLEDNTSIDNAGPGIVLSSAGTGVVIRGGNLYGNLGNCALDNSSADAVTVDGVYWGAASGPGLDPADALCGNTAAILVTNPAAKAAKIKVAPIK